MTLPASFRRIPLSHRGLHDVGKGVIENSESAVRAAISAGYGIEVDVRMSRDGQAMVFHDMTLDRLTASSGPVEALSAEDLGRIGLTGSGDTIPTLGRVLSTIGGRVPLLVEIKDRGWPLGGSDGRIEEAVARSLRDYRGPVAVMSFDPDIVAGMADRLPQVPRGLTTCDFSPEHWPLDGGRLERLRRIADFDRVGATFVSHQAADLGRDRIADLAEAGADILCWTIRSPAEEAAARRVACNITFEQYRPVLPMD